MKISKEKTLIVNEKTAEFVDRFAVTMTINNPPESHLHVGDERYIYALSYGEIRCFIASVIEEARE